MKELGSERGADEGSVADRAEGAPGVAVVLATVVA